MKKVLLATSALVLTAGAAAADIKLSGSARMGIVHIDNGSDPSSTQFSSRVRIVFTASGETDTGLSFGASTRADQEGGNDASNGSGGTDNDESTVFISGAFGTLTMGDVSGAADALVGQVSGVGYGPNDDTQEINFLGTVKTALYYEYSAGALTFGAGVGQMDAGGDTYNIGAKYAADGYAVSLAYESAENGIEYGMGFYDADMISLGASATFGAATVKARVSDLSVDGFVEDVDTVYALSVDYAMGDTTLTAFYTDYGNSSEFLNPYADGADTGPDGDTTHIGLGAAYSLGGGATLAGGVTRQNNSQGPDQTIANLGLKFSF